MSKVFYIADAGKASMLRAELTKVRCWMTGFHAGRDDAGTLGGGIPGEDSLRQIIIAIDDALRDDSKVEAETEADDE